MPVDMIGTEMSSFLYIQVDGVPASFEERSLPVSALALPYRQYRHIATELPPGWNITVAVTGPWFGRPGGARQVRVLDAAGKPVSVDKLINRGMLVPA